MLNLVSVCNSSDPSVIWGFIREYDKNKTKEKNHYIDKLVSYAINYYSDFVLPNKKYLKIREKNLHKMKPIPVCIIKDE